jgi:hypothetical protein
MFRLMHYILKGYCFLKEVLHFFEGKLQRMNERCALKHGKERCNILVPSKNVVFFDLSMCVSFLRVE